MAGRLGWGPRGWRRFLGLLLAGWGIFNVVEGVVDHHVLSLHHVRDDVTDPRWWDAGFLGFGVALLAVGLLLCRMERRSAASRVVGRR